MNKLINNLGLTLVLIESSNNTWSLDKLQGFQIHCCICKVIFKYSLKES